MKAGPSQEEDSTDIWKPLLVGVLGVFGLFVGFVVFLFCCPQSLGGFPAHLSERGQFGDSFGPLTSLFTGLAFGGVLVSLILQRRELISSLKELKHSVVAQQQIATGSAHERIFHHNLEFLRYLADHPKLRPHFYDNKSHDALSEEDKNRALCAAEMLAGFLELIVLQKDHLEAAVPSWEKFIRDIYRTSPPLRQYFAEHDKWYVPELMDYFKDEI